MLGSNPSADSVASTDRLRGCFGIPFSIPSLQRAPASGEAPGDKSWGAGAKPLQPAAASKLSSKQGASHNA
jgi:hypothetical protein